MILLGLNRGLDKPPYLGKDPEFVNKREILVPIFILMIHPVVWILSYV